MKFIKKLLTWSLFASALTPAIYGNATITPAQNAKTLFIRFCLSIVSVCFVVLFTQSSEFRTEIKNRIALLWKHPIFKITTALYVILVISTIFAYHHFIAFLGEVEREEGLLGLTFFYGFFYYALCIFRKKDWRVFFGILMFTQIPVLLLAIAQFAQGSVRSNSILGNPIYFAAYALCLLFISIIMYVEAKRKNFSGEKLLCILSIIMAIVELGMSNTRSVLLGIIVAIPVSFVYVFINTESVFPKIPKQKIRKTVILLFSLFLVFASVFIATRHAKVWSHIPGLNRISAYNVDDASTRARLVSWGIAFRSVNPVHAGIVRSLVGYGWDNYFYAWQKFYNPSLYQYDGATFDRPHNKILDMVVMNGVLGLVAYLLFWYLFLRTVIKHRKKDGVLALWCVFWATAYFVQNLFGFDTIILWIISFAIFAFIIEETLYEYEK